MICHSKSDCPDKRDRSRAVQARLDEERHADESVGVHEWCKPLDTKH
jgi:hypothetical protein